MTKKRKSTPQSATLHDFFGKPSQATAKKAKVEASVHRTTAKKQGRPSVPRGIDPAEIIVIDSDEDTLDGVPQVTSVHSAKRAGVIEGHNSNMTRVKAASLKENTQSSASDTRAAAKQGGVSTTIVHPDTTDQDYFGIPFLLTPEGLDVDAAPLASSAFGTPSLLLSRAASTTQTVPITGRTTPLDGCTPPPLKTSRSNEQSLQVFDEDWAMGDDEVEFDNPELLVDVNDEDAVDIDLTLDDADEVPVEQQCGVETCPLCDRVLRGLSDDDVQEHVNKCIDTMTTALGHDAPSPSPSASLGNDKSTSRPLRSISSFQTEPIPSTSKVKLEDGDPLRDEKSGVFSVLMSSHKENEAWKEATVAEDRNFKPTKGNGGRRKAPFYKIMQGMPIAVDAFRYGTIPGVTAYFLTHAHSDHYTNLSSKWDNGLIYCSEGTANLILHMLGVDRKWVCPLPMDVATTIPDTGGVQVTLIEANHCPGSCLFLFEGKQTVNAGDSAYQSAFVGSSKIFRYLHCGDFRASPAHAMHPSVKGKHIDLVYLDTTYLDPKYCFPPQPQVISACAELARRIIAGVPLYEDAAKAKQNRTMDGWVTATVKTEPKDKELGRTLVVIGTYSIGKERIVKAVARALQTKVYCEPRKTAILRCQSDPELHSLLTKDPFEGGVHLVPLNVIASDRLKDYVERFKGHYTKVVGFRPTGWTFTAPTGSDMLPSVQTIISRSQSRTFTHAQLNPMKNSSAAVQVYGVPYSEHSSFFELTCFALSLDWGKLIATVNVASEKSRKKMSQWFERWEAEKKKRPKGDVLYHRADDYW